MDVPTTHGLARHPRSPAEQVRELEIPTPSRRDDPARWHLVAAAEAMDEQRWDVAREALRRAGQSVEPGSVDGDSLAYLTLRLAIATVDLRSATSEVMALASRMDPTDAVWNQRVREIISAAPAVFARSMRGGLLELLPDVPVSRARAGSLGPHPAPDGRVAGNPDREDSIFVTVPAGGLPALLDEEEEEFDGDRALRGGADAPAPAGGVSGPAGDGHGRWSGAETGGGGGAVVGPSVVQTEGDAGLSSVVDDADLGVDEVVINAGEEYSWSTVQGGFLGRVHVPGESVDLTDADALRDRLVEEMLANVTGEEGSLLFDTASSFLNNADFETAEVMFAAAMQVPELRVAACEGLMQTLVRAGRYEEAVSSGARAARVFAKEGDALAGVMYWNGIAAEALGDAMVARTCFARVVDGPAGRYFPDAGVRLAGLRA